MIHPQASIHLYGPAYSTFVRTAALVCEEKGIQYTLGLEIDAKAIDFKGPEHLAMHPFGKIPALVITELDGSRKTLAETAGIGRYLDNRFGVPELQGETDWQRAQVDQWCSLISGYVDHFLVRQFMLELAFPKGEKGQPRLDVLAAARPQAIEALQIVSDQLADQQFLLGEQLSLADLLLAPMLAYNSETPEPFNLVSQFENLMSYTERLLTRPKFDRVLVPLNDAKSSKSAA